MGSSIRSGTIPKTNVFRIAQQRVYPNKGTKSTIGIGGVQALSACSFAIASDWFQ